MTLTPVLSVRNLGKSYANIPVLADISFDLRPGETAALVGENGAGKSTLAKIIAGSIRPDAGTVFVDGDSVNFGSPREALAVGIAFIPQELVYVPELSVAENITLGSPPARAGFTSQRRMMALAEQLIDKAGFELPLSAMMSSLSLAQRQLVEIAKAVSRNARIIILDEPTAALEAEDSRQLQQLVSQLASQGVGIIYISHRLDEVFTTCDTIHSLRNGALVRSSAASEVTPAEIIADMLGRQLKTGKSFATRSIGAAVLRVENINRSTAPTLDAVEFTVGRGEILGVYGLRGSGADTVAETLGGLHPDASGAISVGSMMTTAIRTARESWDLGIAYVPADRKSQGLVLIDTISRSFSLPNLASITRLGFIHWYKERLLARELYQRVSIKSRSIHQVVGELSGGNQQKVLVGSRLLAKKTVLVLHEPTRGVDVGARQEIHDLLKELADAGTAQLVVTSDVEEAVKLCDRLLIIHRGRIVLEINDPSMADQAEAIQAAGGIS